MNTTGSVLPIPNGEVKISQRNGKYGIPDTMLHGFQNVKSNLTQPHPLQYSEEQWHANQEKMDFTMLRNTQGSHAPMRLQMERNMARKVQRLPGLRSSNIMLDTLTGSDEMIEFEDILNNPLDPEAMGQPHAMMEQKLKLL